MRRSWFLAATGPVVSASILAATVAAASARLGGGDGGDRGGEPPPPPAPTPGSPLPDLDAGDLARFEAGLAQFTEVEDLAGGLGPVFNDSSCVACHSAGGVGGGGSRTVTRFGRTTNGLYDPMIEFGGPLVQSRGIGPINGVNFVGEVVPRQATIVARRRTTPLFGLGLVDAVPDATLIQVARWQQQNTPATAGRPGMVADPGVGGNQVGRFGWKAQHAGLFAFASDAYTNELGVTTPEIPSENCPQGRCQLLAANPAATRPNDLDDGSIRALADFLTLAAPPAPAHFGPDPSAGRALFAAIGCADCHTPTLRSGPSPVGPLSDATFDPYSDFLLHDMGALGDGITQGDAGPREMRTAPLWGLRYQPAYLHDGRSSTLADAILQHSGQGSGARARFAGLGRSQQAQLLAFLGAL